jgi:hypothetical protein
VQQNTTASHGSITSAFFDFRPPESKLILLIVDEGFPTRTTSFGINSCNTKYIGNSLRIFTWFSSRLGALLVRTCCFFLTAAQLASPRLKEWNSCRSPVGHRTFDYSDVEDVGKRMLRGTGSRLDCSAPFANLPHSSILANEALCEWGAPVTKSEILAPVIK